ncbi:hypothetical protein ACHAXR_003628 [Thalassiosira sp. AJA248-18]
MAPMPKIAAAIFLLFMPKLSSAFSSSKLLAGHSLAFTKKASTTSCCRGSWQLLSLDCSVWVRQSKHRQSQIHSESGRSLKKKISCAHSSSALFANDSNMMATATKSDSPNSEAALNVPMEDEINGDDDVAERLPQEEEEEEEEEGTTIENLPKGMPNGFYIINHATMPQPHGFTQSQLEDAFSKEDITRLKLQPDNVTVPVALKLLFPEQFSLTRARKESRRRKILLHRGPPLVVGGEVTFDSERLSVGKVGDRVRPGDTVAIQTRMTHNYDECKNHHKEPPFHLPVVYEDDHFAIVNKPEGIVVYGHKNGGYGRNTVKSCLPWVLTPPKAGVMSVMRRPSPVHRIDRGTSGLLVCAKTKPAMVELALMFKDRRVKKTYTAIVNGDIQEPKETSISSTDAKNLGVCIGNDESDSKKETDWQLIDEELEDQSAVTIWRALRRWPLENARNDTVTLVELKPKTGRYHQLRRHMAWVSKCPLLGDKSYDGGGLAKTLRDQGFYLCSNRVTLEHPYYNSPQGRQEWNANKEKLLGEKDGGVVRVTEEKDGTVLIHCEIDLPAKFSEVLES